MSNKLKKMSTKNYTYYFFNDFINIKHFDPNSIKMDEKSYWNIFIYYIGYVTIKDSKYIKINSVNPLYLIFSSMNEYFEKINGNKYWALVPINASREKVLKNEELWSKIRELIRFITKNSDDCDERCMEIKFNSDYGLPLKKTIEIPSRIIFFRAVFHGNNKDSQV